MRGDLGALFGRHSGGIGGGDWVLGGMVMEKATLRCQDRSLGSGMCSVGGSSLDLRRYLASSRSRAQKCLKIEHYFIQWYVLRLP